MTHPPVKPLLARCASDYGILLALLALCGYYSVATIDWQHPTGASAGRQLAARIARQCGAGSTVLVAARATQEDALFADALARAAESEKIDVLAVVKGDPADARAALAGIARAGRRLQVIACNRSTAAWSLWENLDRKFPALAGVRVMTPQSYRWPNFLMPANLLNVTNQIVIIAILAIGMTMVILTGGIDLSVGSLVALSAVVAALLLRDVAGAESASAAAVVLCCLAGIAACAAIGLISGLAITCFDIPPFVVTLAMMWVARGLARTWAKEESVNQLPDSLTWLGWGRALPGIPNAVVMMVALYAAAHLLMTRTPLGRYIYAVGGNAQAARLSGVPVGRIRVFVYAVCGTLAGLGGVVLTSQLKSGSPVYGNMYELYTIAAVVVGGTSLAGGEGRVLGTLIGAFIIAVIQNGMNLTGVNPRMQMVVLGLVLLGAVLLDTVRRRRWNLLFGLKGLRLTRDTRGT
jgi:ribose transport system permease protein